jgi:hypothetical protein
LFILLFQGAILTTMLATRNFSSEYFDVIGSYHVDPIIDIVIAVYISSTFVYMYHIMYILIYTLC